MTGIAGTGDGTGIGLRDDPSQGQLSQRTIVFDGDGLQSRQGLLYPGIGFFTEKFALGAVVSRGGRVDLAGQALPSVTAPTLMIVGGEDHAVLALNQAALEDLECERRLEVVPGAGHLFEEPGALEQVAVLARDWFLAHLGPGDA